MFNIPTQRLAKVTVTETTTAVTLSVNPIVIAALSFTPRHLVVKVNAKTAYSSGDRDNIQLRFNGDTGSNYDSHYISGVGSSPGSAKITAATTYLMGQTAGDDANWFAGGECLIPDALSTRTDKTMLSITGSNEDIVQTTSGRWANTAAITSVNITPYQSGAGWLTGSTFELCVVDETFNKDQDGDGELILGSDGNFTVASISAADGDLVCIGNVRADHAVNNDVVYLSMNGDTTDANYPLEIMYASHGTGSAALAAAAVSGRPDVGICNAASVSDTNAFSPFVVQFPNFSRGSNDRVWHSMSGAQGSPSYSVLRLFAGRWNNTAAITSLGFYGGGTNLKTNSMLSTYVVPKNLIERQELESAAGSVTFSSIPQTYDHLEVSWYSNSDEDVTAIRGVSTTFNGDTGTNYAAQVLEGSSSGTGAASLTGQTNMPYAATTEGASGAANEMSGGTFTVQNYTKTDRHKHLLAMSGISERRVWFGSNRWASTAAVTSITLTQDGSGDFIAGSVFTLRGINAAPAAATDIETINGIAAADIEAVN